MRLLGLTDTWTRRAAAGAMLFVHTTMLSSEALSLTFKTVAGYTNPYSEGTWVNDLTHCLRGRLPHHAVRIRMEEDGFMRRLVAKAVCGTIMG